MNTSLKQNLTESLQAQTSHSCTHCGNPIFHRSLEKASKTEAFFCCAGCATVYQLLQKKGLGHYYEIKKQSPWIRSALPAASNPENFSYLDNAEFLQHYANLSPHANLKMEFYLEGVHCVACLWLIEKLPEFLLDVKSAQLDLGKSIATITLNLKGSFANVAQTLSSFGYKPHPLKQEEDGLKLQKRENQSLLIRLGVAGGCTGNIMLMAVSLYGGAQGNAGRLFQWMSLLLFLPVIFYCAIPFYQSSYAALKTRTLSIDVPIVMAVLLGALASIANLLRGSPLIYFDSLSALVFLLLISRYVLKRIQQNVFSSSHLLHFLSASQAKRFNRDTQVFEEISASILKAGDYIRVLENEVIPADGVVRKGVSILNNALLTGESEPVRVQEGERVYSGTVNLSEALEIEVTAAGSISRLGLLLKEIESGHLQKAPVVQFADRLSRVFIWGVLAAAAALFLYFFQSSPEAAFSRALTLVIVTCPCTLAFATPLALSITLKRAARQGILIKGSDILEKLTQARSLLLDKTGTLTEGDFELLQWMEKAEQGASIPQAVYSLELRSKHPIAQALVRHLQTNQKLEVLPVTEFKEILGQGVSGKVNGVFYEIHSKQNNKNFSAAKLGNHLGVWRNGELVAQAILGDTIRSDSAACLEKLRSLGLEPHILSGDTEETVKKVGELLDILPAHQMPLASPEAKKEFLQNFPRAIMVGDGANDSLALSSAYVGIAVHGSMEVSLRAADVYLTRPGLKPLIELVQIARDTLQVIHRNFAFSLFYNLLGATLSALGYIHPLVAAVLMPVSSLSVLSSSLWGTKKLRTFGRFGATT
ncbi:MAG: heavy metal translocating P-type ATPase [Deltaproteobacteria bacterium]|nr:heavy metal translocating P-type ATPase [Deltaproteobacteria bacterium]